MGYPYDKTYLEQIQENKDECEKIQDTFYILRRKYVREHPKHSDIIELSIKENFTILGEAFELSSNIVDGITDVYHFMWDILDELLTPKVKDDSTNNHD